MDIHQALAGNRNLLYTEGCVRESLLLRQILLSTIYANHENQGFATGGRNLLYTEGCVRESLLLRQILLNYTGPSICYMLGAV